ncbi:threonine-phosphate decarboxylase CobD [Neobacillus sp. K501]
MKWPSHGSNPQYLYKAMGLELPGEYIDFSANINPIGPPAAIKEKWGEFYREISVYPDPYAFQLKEMIAKRESISPDSIIIGNGGAELITLVARMLAGKKIGIIQPTFSEYEKACLANKCEISYHSLAGPDFSLTLPDLSKVDALFLCNPNNPTGVHYPPSKLKSIMEECEKHRCLLILDEAFYDFLSNYESIIPNINQFPRLIVLRSMTKMFAIPGIRLGYLVAAPKIIHELNTLQSHWSVNTIALRSGELCLQDETYIKDTQRFIDGERKRLFEFFTQADFEVSPSKVNFYLLRDSKILDQFRLFEILLHRGIIPRHTFNFPGLDGNWLRFAIKGKDENDQLMEVLLAWRQHQL